MKSKRINVASEEVEYEIIRSSRRTVALYVRPGGTLLIRAPWYVPAYVLMKFVESKTSWITRQRERLIHIKPLPEEIPINDGTILKYLGKDITVRTSAGGRNEVTLSGNNLQVTVRGIIDPAKITVLVEGWYLREAREYFSARTAELAMIHGDHVHQPASVSVRKMKKRWGTCKSDGSIWFNRELIKKEKRLIDSVIIHELCHLVHPNHSRRFYDLVEDLMPGYSQLRKELRNL